MSQIGIRRSEFFLPRTTFRVRNILKTAILAAAAFVLVPAAMGVPLRLPSPTPWTPDSIPAAITSTNDPFPASDEAGGGIFSLLLRAPDPFSAVITTDLDPDEQGTRNIPFAAEALLKLAVNAPEPPSLAMFSIGVVCLYLGRKSKRSLRRQRHLNPLRRRIKTDTRMMAS